MLVTVTKTYTYMYMKGIRFWIQCGIGTFILVLHKTLRKATSFFRHFRTPLDPAISKFPPLHHHELQLDSLEMYWHTKKWQKTDKTTNFKLIPNPSMSISFSIMTSRRLSPTLALADWRSPFPVKKCTVTLKDKEIDICTHQHSQGKSADQWNFAELLCQFFYFF